MKGVKNTPFLRLKRILAILVLLKYYYVNF